MFHGKSGVAGVGAQTAHPSDDACQGSAYHLEILGEGRLSVGNIRITSTAWAGMIRVESPSWSSGPAMKAFRDIREHGPSIRMFGDTRAAGGRRLSAAATPWRPEADARRLPARASWWPSRAPSSDRPNCRAGGWAYLRPVRKQWHHARGAYCVLAHSRARTGEGNANPFISPDAGILDLAKLHGKFMGKGWIPASAGRAGGTPWRPQGEQKEKYGGESPRIQLDHGGGLSSMFIRAHSVTRGEVSCIAQVPSRDLTNPYWLAATAGSRKSRGV